MYIFPNDLFHSPTDNNRIIIDVLWDVGCGEVRLQDCATVECTLSFPFHYVQTNTKMYLLLPVYIMATRPNEIGNHFLASLVSRFLNEIRPSFLNRSNITTAVNDYDMQA